MNEHGISQIETILALVIFFLISLTLLPVSYSLQSSLQRQVLSYHASEVAYNGANIVKNYGQAQGVQIIDQTTYTWSYDAHRICVTYQFEQESYEQCIS